MADNLSMDMPDFTGMHIYSVKKYIKLATNPKLS